MPVPMGCIFFPRKQHFCGLTVSLAPLTLELHWSQRPDCEVGHGKRVSEKQLERGWLAGFECEDNMEIFFGNV